MIVSIDYANVLSSIALYLEEGAHSDVNFREKLNEHKNFERLFSVNGHLDLEGISVFVYIILN